MVFHMNISAKTAKQIAALALALLMGTSLLACGGEEAKCPQTTDPGEKVESTPAPEAENHRARG